MRKQILGLALLAGLPFKALYALGLGEVELHSALNEPLSAEISLTAAQVEELQRATVQLGSYEAFNRAGIERQPILSSLVFEFSTKPDGSSVISIKSSEPIREPFLDFLIEVNWPSGHLLREYTLLLDPPVVSSETPAPVTEPEVAAAAGSEQAMPPAEISAQEPAPEEAVAPQAIDESATPPAEDQLTETETAAAVPAELPPAEEPGSLSAQEPAATSQAPAVKRTQGMTRASDTLWDIARQTRPSDSVSVQQMMIALLKANPRAFYHNNINNLMAGYVLRTPDIEAINALSQDEAAREVHAQYKSWLQSRRSSTASGGQPSAEIGSVEGAAVVSDKGAHLKLVSARAETQGSSGSGGKTAEKAAGLADLEKMRAELATAVEALDATKRENEELRSRLTALEEQLSSMHRLLNLKDDTLVNLQNKLSADQAGKATETPKPKPGAEQAAKPAQPPVSAAMAPQPAAGGFLQDALSNPAMLGGVVAVVVLIGALIARAMQRRKSAPDMESVLKANEEVKPEEPGGPVAEVVAQETSDAVVMADEQPIIQGEEAKDIFASQEEEPQVDPLVEVDVYLAYRRYQQAEQLVKEAIAKEPDRHEFRVKLLEIYYAAKDKKAFAEQAEELFKLVNGTGDPLWLAIVPMGRELCPEHELFGGGGETTVRAAEDAGNNVVQSPEQSGSESPHEELAVQAPVAEAPVDNAIEFDLSGEFEAFKKKDAAEDAISQASSPLLETTPAVDGAEHVAEFDLDLDADAVKPAGGEESAEAQQETAPDFNMDFNLSDTDFLAGADVVDTKLDLARAYIDMGDRDSARDILNEVLQEGSEKQKEEAQQLMQRIA